jgi:carboxyl-terminal processing protease
MYSKVGKTKALKRRRFLNILVTVLVLVLVFTIGLFIGDGRINFNRNRTIATGLPSKLDYSSVNAVYNALRTNYDGKLTETQLLNGLKHGLAESTNDPYTEYFTASEAKAFNGQINNSFSGIGAQLGADSKGDIEVIAPISGLPADKAGLKPKDLIASINGKSTAGQSVDDVVNEVRGPNNTKVTLQVIRNGTQSLTLTITRKNINLPSVNTKILSGNIGYMQITTFANDTDSLSQKAATQFASAHVKGIILDLRDDPGGLLQAAVHVSSLWLPQGTKVLDEKRGSQVVQSYSALGGDTLHGIPTVILINDGSASASEITTGALHDNKAAYVIGEKSYGKGVVQDLICITGPTNSDGSCPSDELKVTVASWYRPNGQNINHLGITPDQTVKLTDQDVSSGNDVQLSAAESYLSK